MNSTNRLKEQFSEDLQLLAKINADCRPRRTLKRKCLAQNPFFRFLKLFLLKLLTPLFRLFLNRQAKINHLHSTYLSLLISQQREFKESKQPLEPT